MKAVDANHGRSSDQRNATRRSGTCLGDPGPGAGPSTATPESQAGRRGETVLGKLTTHLVDTYFKCGLPSHEQPKTARRILTKNSQVVSNNGWDNSDNNIVLRVRDLLEVQSNTGVTRTFVVLDLLGQGTFGQVFRCQDVATKAVMAIKIIRNHPSYYKQALVEVQVSQLLTSAVGMEGQDHVVELLDYFMFQHHLCLVFELLSVNLYELLSQNSFRGLPLTIVRGFLHQILRSLVLLHNSYVIHCDLKPENILLSGHDRLFTVPSLHAHDEDVKQVVPGIKLVDFGSACYENETVFSYIQSRFYRSPEVLLGLPYCGAIDMWSLGCVSAEMYLGLPLFPGASDHDQLQIIIDTVGYPPLHMVQNGTNLRKFFKVTKHNEIALKTPDEYARDTNTRAVSSKRYFKHSALRDIIDAYPFRKGASDEEVAKERNHRAAFSDFVRGLLALDPRDRWTPQQAMHHPFITGVPFTHPYKPRAPPARRLDVRFRSPMVPMECTPHYALSSSAPPPGPPPDIPYYLRYPMYSHSCPYSIQRELFPPMEQLCRPTYGHHNGTQHDDCHRDFGLPPDHWDPFFTQGSDESLAAPPLPPEHRNRSLHHPSTFCGCTTVCSCGRAPHQAHDSPVFHRKWRRRKQRDKQIKAKQ
ncbi:CMGC/DYRK/YAK protein kinase [Aphanomyces invadans]|uniref:CMGC/DYRK/YAK protein kinase n=1 Tax=Aphanomyces invadans TaxID=157072 RepID=A0A024TEZ7_9STRA|nr:CMGC/DYRK/YAK protein kinase [Aphanomyces invadans]ETV92618.1 CMGC/DYRK/YAK protein kinase [Aphanomyces invadans]|eukprot:XP_008878654.1 CMGC/DYRK/YAK protein kinase [Aphanomyces invadans]